MTTWQAMHRLEELGYTFILTDEGKVQGRIRNKPPEASALLAIARADRESAADYVRQRQQGVNVMAVEREVTLHEALAVSMAMQTGEAQLMGKVRLSGGHIFITWVGAELPTWIEKARGWVREEVRRMDESPYWELTAEDFTKMCARYAMYKEMCEA